MNPRRTMRSSAATMVPVLAMTLACAGLDFGEPVPDPHLPASAVSNPELEATLAAQTVEGTPETEVLEVRLATLEDTTATGVLYTKDGDGWCRARPFEATKKEDGWETDAGKPKVRTCPATPSARSVAPDAAMDAVQTAVPTDYRAKIRDPELESAICQTFNTLDWEETFFGASIYQPWQEKRVAGAVVSRSAPAWLFAVSPDGRCRRQDFTVQQVRRGDGSYAEPRRLSTGGYDDMRCPAIDVVQEGLLACTPSTTH